MQIHGTWAILEGTGIPLNVRNQADEPVIVLAAEIGCEEIVKMLILEGAHLDLQDHEDGYTSLHCAALNDHIQCGVLLTEGGANVGIKDKHSQTAVNVASSLRGVHRGHQAGSIIHSIKDIL